MGSVVLFLLISSCTKNTEQFYSDNNSYRPPIEVNFLADYWEKDATGNFTSVSADALRSGPDGSWLRVYVVLDDQELLISSTPIGFMDGTIWSTTSGSDLIITYQPNDPNADMPFTELKIKMVFTI